MKLFVLSTVFAILARYSFAKSPYWELLSALEKYPACSKQLDIEDNLKEELTHLEVRCLLKCIIKDGEIDLEGITEALNENDKFEEDEKENMIASFPMCLEISKEITDECRKYSFFILCFYSERIERTDVNGEDSHWKKTTESEAYAPCAKELNIEGKPYQDHTDREMDCLITCMIEKNGGIKDGELIPDGVIKSLKSSTMRDNIKESMIISIPKCIEDTKDITDKCDKGFEFNSCLYEEANKLLNITTEWPDL